MVMTLRGLTADQAVSGLSMLADSDEESATDVLRWAAVDGEAVLEVLDDRDWLLDYTVVACAGAQEYSLRYQGKLWRAIRLWWATR